MPAVEKISMTGTLKELDFTWLHTFLLFTFRPFKVFDIWHSWWGAFVIWHLYLFLAAVQVSCIYPLLVQKFAPLHVQNVQNLCVLCRLACNVPIKQQSQASPAFSTFQREPGPRNSLFFRPIISTASCEWLCQLIGRPVDEQPLVL